MQFDGVRYASPFCLRTALWKIVPKENVANDTLLPWRDGPPRHLSQVDIWQHGHSPHRAFVYTDRMTAVGRSSCLTLQLELPDLRLCFGISWASGMHVQLRHDGRHGMRAGASKRDAPSFSSCLRYNAAALNRNECRPVLGRCVEPTISCLPVDPPIPFTAFMRTKPI